MAGGHRTARKRTAPGLTAANGSDLAAIFTERANQVSTHYLSASHVLPCSHDVEQAAIHRLRERPFLPESRVSCQFDAGVLLLRGRLSSYYHKQVAQEAVKGIEGVTDIVNEIEVPK